MEFDLFKEWLPSITEKKDYLFGKGLDESTERKYPSFMINRALSQYEDTVFFANEINRFSGSLDPKLQYDFLYHFVPKKKRFSKWAKGIKSDDIALLMKTYNISAKKAEEIHALLGSDEMSSIKEYMNTGGRDGSRKK